MTAYRAVALVLAIVFAAVGAIFLIAPGAMADLVNAAASRLAVAGMPAGDVQSGLFRTLAVAYMYVVTLMAWMMFRQPHRDVWPTLLAHAKLCSAILALALFVAHDRYFVYIANAVVDGAIGTGALLLRRHVRASATARGGVQAGALG